MSTIPAELPALSSPLAATARSLPGLSCSLTCPLPSPTCSPNGLVAVGCYKGPASVSLLCLPGLALHGPQAGLANLLLKLPSLLRSECRELAAGMRCAMKGKLSEKGSFQTVF